jgi:hypothetical protein
MNILALIADNATRRAAITVAPLAPGMSPAALQNDKVSNVCRAPGTVMKIIVVFDKPEMVGAWHLPHCNISPTSTARTISFADASGTQNLQDTGIRLARPWADITPKGNWTPAQWASAYRHGGGAQARGWLTNHVARRLEITLSDPDNLQGYIEVADIFAGSVWSPSTSPDYNPSLTPDSTAESFLDGSGASRSIPGTKSKRLAISLSGMSEVDRAELWGIQVGNGIEYPSIVSLYPNDPFGTRERDHQLLGSLVQTSAIRRPSFSAHSTSVEWKSR